MENNEIKDENIEKENVNNSDFNGTFHERDSLAENNIVDEVKNSFLGRVLKQSEKLWVITILMVIHLFMKQW